MISHRPDVLGPARDLDLVPGIVRHDPAFHEAIRDYDGPSRAYRWLRDLPSPLQVLRPVYEVGQTFDGVVTIRGLSIGQSGGEIRSKIRLEELGVFPLESPRELFVTAENSRMKRRVCQRGRGQTRQHQGCGNPTNDAHLH